MALQVNQQPVRRQATALDERGTGVRAWLLGGATALLVARPLFPSESMNVGDGLTVVMLWLALAVAWLFAAIRWRSFSLRFGPTDAAVLLLLVWYAVAALWPAEYHSPRPTLNAMWEWIGLGIGFLMVRQVVATAREARAVTAVMITLAVAVSSYGLFQSWWEMPRARAIYAADPDAAMRAAGMWFPPDSAERKHFEDRLQNTEPLGTFALTNSLAAFLTPWLIILLGITASVRKHRRQLLAVAICLLPVVVCLAATKSRSGYIAACVGIAIVCLLSGQTRWRLGWKLPAVALGLGLAVATAAMIVKGPAVFGRAAKSFGYRVQYWQSSLAMVSDHPWIGCGPGNFQEMYTSYKLPEASEEVADPHNFLLEIWTNAGTPAAVAFLLVLFFFFRATTAVQVEGQEWDEDGTASNPKNGEPPRKGASVRTRSDAWLHVIVGGMAGFLLSLPLAALSAAPPSPAAVMIGLPIAAAVVALLLGWIREGQMPLWLPGVGVAVLLIDLLASGGISFPGVAASLWLLVALGLRGQGWRPSHRVLPWLLLVVALGLMIACYETAYRPVLACRAQLEMAEREPQRADEHFEAAAAADPLAADPWRLLADLRFHEWVRQPDAATFSDVDTSSAKTVQLAPFSSADWAAAGTRYLLAAQTGSVEKPFRQATLQKAIVALQRATALYPNSAAHRARLAEAYHEAKDLPAFKNEAERALRLDEITPHAEKKLPKELRERLCRWLSRSR